MISNIIMRFAGRRNEKRPLPVGQRALRLSKNFVFPTICVLTSQNTDVRKFPCGNFLPLKVSKPRYTPPVLIYLLLKYYFMRAAARQRQHHENELY